MDIKYSKKFDDENIITKTSIAEIESETNIDLFFIPKFYLLNQKHIKYLLNHINEINYHDLKKENLSVWNPLYVLGPLTCLNYNDQEKLNLIKNKYLNYLKKRLTKEGLFSGFNYDFPNLISNYATINSIILIGTEESYQLINRELFYKYLLSLKTSENSFCSSNNGESDLRSTFSAIYIAYMLNILTDELIFGVKDFVKSCFNYDGGFSPLPGRESHGGYVHCGIGILYMLNCLNEINLYSTIRWLSSRQMEYSGGLQGRTNKLVDSCYSWWQGSSMKIISNYLNIEPFWDKNGITNYILKCSQSVFGGFYDHPPSKVDNFHTLYSLAGLCICGDCKDFNFIEVNALSGVSQELTKKFQNYFKNN